jgi:hypothetical protein
MQVIFLFIVCVRLHKDVSYLDYYLFWLFNYRTCDLSSVDVIDEVHRKRRGVGTLWDHDRTI